MTSFLTNSRSPRAQALHKSRGSAAGIGGEEVFFLEEGEFLGVDGCLDRGGLEVVAVVVGSVAFEDGVFEVMLGGVAAVVVGGSVATEEGRGADEGLEGERSCGKKSTVSSTQNRGRG